MHQAAELDSPASECGRIELMLRRDGLRTCAAWVTRTMRIYRRAVLDPEHFAHSEPYRRRFIASYCEFKRWLAAMGEVGQQEQR